MKCNHCRKYLIPCSEGTLPERLQRPVEAHLAACRSCAEELAQLRQTVDVLRQTDYPAMEPAFDLRSRVMAQIAHVPAPIRKSWWGAYSAAAAALLIFAVVMVTMEPVFFTSRQATRHESSIQRTMPQEKSLKSISPNAQALSKVPDMDERVSPTNSASKSPAPEVKAPAMITHGSKPEGTKGAVMAQKPSAEFYTELSPPPAPPEEYAYDMAKSTHDGDRLGAQGPAGPSPMAQAERAGAVPENINVGFEDGALEKADNGRILELERKLKEFPNSRTALTELLKAYKDAGRSEDEYAIAVRLTKLDADNPQYWFARAQAAERAGKPRAAESAYRQAIQLKLSGPDLELAKGRLEVLESDKAK